MKLHVDKKKRGAIRKYLSILLVVCIVLSNGSTYAAASAGGEDGHQHDDGCYTRQSVGELAEHGEMMEATAMPTTEIATERSRWLAAGWRSIMRAATKKCWPVDMETGHMM